MSIPFAPESHSQRSSLHQFFFNFFFKFVFSYYIAKFSYGGTCTRNASKCEWCTIVTSLSRQLHVHASLVRSRLLVVCRMFAHTVLLSLLKYGRTYMWLSSLFSFKIFSIFNYLILLMRSAPGTCCVRAIDIRIHFQLMPTFAV